MATPKFSPSTKYTMEKHMSTFNILVLHFLAKPESVNDERYKTLIIGTHGISENVYDALREAFLKILNVSV